MEDALTQILISLSTKFPWVLAIYGAATSFYTAFCFISTLTKTDKDDKIAAKLRVFFSLPVNKDKK